MHVQGKKKKGVEDKGREEKKIFKILTPLEPFNFSSIQLLNT